MRRLLIAALLALLAPAALAGNGIPLLRWAGPPGSRPDTYAEWLARNHAAPFSCVPGTANGMKFVPGDSGAVAVIIQQSISDALSPSLAQLTANLEAEGHAVLQRSVSGGTPQDLRALLGQLRDSAGIDGALLVGDLPVPWFQVEDDYETYGYAEWPCDLYYMDLDGDWLDTISHAGGGWTPGSDGIFDAHAGAVMPEIYVGRLTPTGIGTDTVVLKDYFRKDNAYRRDSIALPPRATVFVDNDWVPWAELWANDVARLYPDTMDFFDTNATRATLYRSRLDSAQAWVSLFAHSSPDLHQFTYGSGSHDYYYSTEYTSQNPPANFYNFFCCSFGRYTSSGYGSGRAVFSQSYGLGAIASAKTGSMLEFTPFYQSLAQGKDLGQSFRDWFGAIIADGVTFDELCWHYGMTLLGDPFLRPAGHHLGVAGAPAAGRSAPATIRLAVSPNPASAHVTIALDSPGAGIASIIVYNVNGQRVRVLARSPLPAGRSQWHWDLRDGNGTPAAAGLYMIRGRAGAGQATARLVVVR